MVMAAINSVNIPNFTELYTKQVNIWHGDYISMKLFKKLE